MPLSELKEFWLDRLAPQPFDIIWYNTFRKTQKIVLDDNTTKVQEEMRFSRISYGDKSAMDEMNQLKVFSVEEANQLLPKITGLLTELQAKQREISTKEVEIDAAELLYPSEEEEPSPVVAREIEFYNESINRFYSILDEIQKMGCFLKDMELGLVDFYTLYQGRVVYLCWKLGEPAVGFWHEVGRSYAYRQPLVPEGEKESSG